MGGNLLILPIVRFISGQLFLISYFRLIDQLFSIAMWKKRFLPYSKEDTKSSPLNLESKKPLDELQHVRGLVQHQPYPQAGHIPPPAHQSSSKVSFVAEVD